jgi:hypothetical protein
VHLSADHFCILDEQVVDYAAAVCEKLLQRQVLVNVWSEDGSIAAEQARAANNNLAEDVGVLAQSGLACVDLALSQAAVALLVNEVRLHPAARQTMGNHGAAQVREQLATKQTAVLGVVVEGMHIEQPGVLFKVLTSLVACAVWPVGANALLLLLLLLRRTQEATPLPSRAYNSLAHDCAHLCPVPLPVKGSDSRNLTQVIPRVEVH